MFSISRFVSLSKKPSPIVLYKQLDMFSPRKLTKRSRSPFFMLVCLDMSRYNTCFSWFCWCIKPYARLETSNFASKLMISFLTVCYSISWRKTNRYKSSFSLLWMYSRSFRRSISRYTNCYMFLTHFRTSLEERSLHLRYSKTTEKLMSRNLLISSENC